MENQTKSDGVFQIYKILWIAMFGMLWLYGVIGYTRFSNQGPSLNPNPIAETILIVGLVWIPVGLFLPKKILQLSCRNLRLQHGNAEPIPFNRLQSIYFVAFLIRLAMFESIAIFGLMIEMISGNFKYQVLLEAISMGLFALNFPTKDKVVAEIDDARRY